MRRALSQFTGPLRSILEPSTTSGSKLQWGNISAAVRGADPSTSSSNDKIVSLNRLFSVRTLQQSTQQLSLSNSVLPGLLPQGLGIRLMSGRVNRNTVRRRRTRIIPRFLTPKATLTMCPKCELVLPDDAVPNRQICSEGDCPALGLNWDGETKVPWFKRRQQVEKAKKERDETQLPERFTAVYELQASEQKRAALKKEKEKRPNVIGNREMKNVR